jgi:hypothetical protein
MLACVFVTAEVYNLLKDKNLTPAFLIAALTLGIFSYIQTERLTQSQNRVHSLEDEITAMSHEDRNE